MSRLIDHIYEVESAIWHHIQYSNHMKYARSIITLRSNLSPTTRLWALQYSLMFNTCWCHFFLSLCSSSLETQGKTNGCGSLLKGDEAEDPTEDWMHSSDEDDQTGDARPSEASSLDCSGSRPLLQDFDEDEEQELGASGNLQTNSSSEPSDIPQSSLITHQPSQNHVVQPSEHDPDVFSKAPFRAVQENDVDVFANAPFPRQQTSSQPPDVFLQAPFGKKKETWGTVYTHPVPQTGMQRSGMVAIAPGSHEQSVLDQVAPLPFRPQALAKYSRHYEGPDVVSSDDPFLSAPFHRKGSQEKH